MTNNPNYISDPVHTPCGVQEYLADIARMITPEAEVEARHREAAQRLADRAAVKERRAHARETPLRTRLKTLLESIDPDERAAGLSITPLCQQLAGRKLLHASAPEVAQELRELGWRRERCWRGGDIGFQSRWFPPPASD